jgi:uncharacterized membrane protein YbaN (DUF454 family)
MRRWYADAAPRTPAHQQTGLDTCREEDIPNGCRNPWSVRFLEVQHTLASTPRVGRTWLRPLYFAAGIISLTVAVIGLFLPLIPTTGPVLLAAFFFARSSTRVHRWLTTHPRFGVLIADFQDGKGIPRRAKVVALAMMTLAFGYGLLFAVSHPIARIVVALVAVGAIGYVARLPVSKA